MSFEKIYLRDVSKCAHKETGQDVLHVRDPHSLVQAAGYLKYKMALNNELIFFRGQTNLYGSLSPSLFRKCTTQKTQSGRINRLQKAIDVISAKNKIINKLSNNSKEALLQHYGLNTSWVDLVDNIWVALWFACHGTLSDGSYGRYVHFERRSVDRETDKLRREYIERTIDQSSGGCDVSPPEAEDITPYAYIILVSVDAKRETGPGEFVGDITEFVDLRVSCPSIFLRPHAQHGVLFRCRGVGPRRPLDYIERVKGIIRISLSDALAWLGSGEALGVRALFPPPYYDNGYKFLLASECPGDPQIGSIAHIGT